MAAQYTEITLDEMNKFLMRGFRALRPKQGVQYNEYYYDLVVSDFLMIRVWTSVKRGTGMGAGVGNDAIRVQVMSVQAKKPVAGKAPIVKRTQGWKNSLQERIEDAMEQIEEKESAADFKNAPPPVVEEEVVDPEPEQEERQEYNGPPLTGTFTQYRGAWSARIMGRGAPGAKAILETKGGKRVPVTLTQKLWGGQDNYGKGYVEVWAIDERQRTAALEGYTYDYRGGVN